MTIDGLVEGKHVNRKEPYFNRKIDAFLYDLLFHGM